MKKILMYLPAFLVMAACNNASTSSETSEQDTSHNMAMAEETPPVPEIPDGARVYFKNLTDGETVSSPFKVEMGVDNMSVDTAGMVKAGSGHHHLLINVGDSLPMGTVVPKDSVHLHFGNAQTETELNLQPGNYKLTLQFADGAHRSYGGKLASSINVTVK